MADIDITRDHTLAPEQLRQRMREIGDKLQERYGIEVTWEDDNTGSIQGRGLNGKIELLSHQVRIQLKLGFGMGFLASKIQDGMEKHLNKVLVV